MIGDGATRLGLTVEPGLDDSAVWKDEEWSVDEASDEALAAD